MKFTLSWLKDHLDTQASLEEISRTLTAIGLEVEEIEDRASLYAPFKVAEIVSAEKHPDADRLKVLTVNTGEEKLQVVCGAPNAKAGMKGIFAPVGSYIPGLETELKKGVIRGVESCGMMVSEREMCLSDEHTGIIEFGDEENHELGTAMAEIFNLDDPVIDIALTPNRGDCAGIRGIARDLAAAGLGTLKPLKNEKIEGQFKTPISVELQEKEACPLFVARMVKGVKNGPSPKWLQDRLKAVGLRPISALVDITNYVSLDLCRPLHVFDANTLKGNIHVRYSKKGETLDALNDKSYTLDDGMTAICDDSGVLGLGGIVGGVPSSCTEETTDVIIECAYFDPMRIAKTGRALGIESDARYRFERGVDPVFTIEGMEIATRLVLDLCGGEAGDVVIAGDIPPWERTIDFDPAYTEKLSGLNIPAETQKNILETLGFEIKGEGRLSIKPPSWRSDVEGRADLVEEVVRIYGYDKLETLSMKKQSTVTHSAETQNMTRIRKSRSALAARGMNECVTWSFLAKNVAEQFGANDEKKAEQLTLLNPISSEMGQMRPSLLPNLLDALKRNEARGFGDNALFEIGPAFQTGKPDGQSTVACGVRANAMGPRHWSSQECARTVDAFDAKADALQALEAAGAPVDNLRITRDAPDWYHPGRSGVLRLGPNVLATFGELHPAVLSDMDVDFPTVGFEVFLNNIPENKKKKKSNTARPPLKLSSFQPVSRDFAFIVDEGVEVADLLRTAQGADKQLVSNVEVFDVYQGKGVEEGKKSVALNVTLQPFDKTLTDEELDAVSRKIIDTIASKTGGQLRG